MPKKKNFLGGQQNYNPNNGQYEPELKGPNGESPSQFSSFKKAENKDKDESFDAINKKRMYGNKDFPTKSVKDMMKPGGLKKEFEDAGFKVSDVTDKSMVINGKYKIVDNGNGGFNVFDGGEIIAEDIGNQKDFTSLIKDYEKEEFDYNYKVALQLNNYEQADKLKNILEKKYGKDSVSVKGVQKALDEMKANFDNGKNNNTDDYVHSEWHDEIKVKKSVYDAFAEQVGWNEDTMKIKDFVEKGNYSKEDLEQLGDYLEEYNYHKSAKVVRNWAETQGNKKNTGIAKTGEWKLTPEIADSIKKNYKTQADAESAVHDVFGGGWDDGSEEGDKKIKDYNAIMKAIADMYGEKPYQEYKTTAKPTVKQEPKEKSLNDYTDDLFKAAKTTTFNSKKYKNPQGEIIEIRRFGEGQNAIRYNETTKTVEQVWINGERVK